MTVHVLLFAVLRDRAGVSQTDVELPPESNVADAAEMLCQTFPAITPFVPRIAFAVNEQYAKPATPLHEGDELALIPPVSGGTSDDWLDLLSSPLEVIRATEFVQSPAAGGVSLFLGTTRADTSPDGCELVALDYQAYESMARKQLSDLAEQARTQWPVIRLVILHRLDRVPLGEASVLIAVSTPHRAESFAACHWIIDELKKEVTIWKQEIWAGREPTWVKS